MQIESTPLYREAMSIIKSSSQKNSVAWDACIHLNDSQVYTPLQVTAVSIRRDYEVGYADEVSCTLMIPLGKYARRVYPNRNHLEITLYKQMVTEGNTQIDYTKPVQTQRYSAVLMDQGNTTGAIAEGQGRESNDEDALDLMNIVQIHFQLFDKAIEQVRMITIGGIFRKTTLDEVILSVLTNEVSKIDVEKNQSILGVDLVDIANVDTKEQIIVTQGTKLVELPNYLQKKYGIYPTGLGSYIQNRMWYVFPLHSMNEFEVREKTLTIIVLPKNKFAEIERSYSDQYGALTVLMTGETGFKDDSGTQYLNEGNGARFANANNFMESFATTKDNKTIISRAGNNSEFIADTKDDNLNNVPFDSTRITSNPFQAYSKITERNGGIFKGVWENSDSSLIEPGMMAKIIYFDKGEVNEIYGIVQAAEHVSVKVGDFVSKKHTTNSIIYIFVNRKNTV